MGWIGHVRVVAHLLLGSVLVVATTVIRTHVTTLRPTALVIAVLSLGATHARLTRAVMLLVDEVWHRLQQHLEIVLELLLIGEFGPLYTGTLSLAERLKVELVAIGLVLELSYLLDLIVVDLQCFVVDGELFLGLGSFIRPLEAYKGIELLRLIWWMHPETLDLTILREEGSQLVLSHCLREAFDVEVAALLGALVLDQLTKTLSLAFHPLQSLLDIELLVVRQRSTIDDNLTIEAGYSF